MSNSDFITDCINADALLEEIEEYIEEWHISETDKPIYDFLGMTQEEYFLWVENDDMLKYIIQAHIQGKHNKM